MLGELLSEQNPIRARDKPPIRRPVLMIFLRRPAMSSLLDDIINLAIDGKQPLPDILRKCLLLGHELKNDQLKAWANQELNGYTDGTTVPAYRVVEAEAKGHFMGPAGREIRNYPIPSVTLNENHRAWAERLDLTQSVSAYDDVLRNFQSNNVVFYWPANLALIYQKHFFSGKFVLVSAWQEVPKTAIVEVLETVRNRTLNLALAIKDELGTSYQNLQKISSSEAAKVESIVVQHIQGANYVSYGNMAIDASTNTEVVINVGDKQKLDELLTGAGLAPTDLQMLTSAIEADGGKRPGGRVASWIKDNAGKVLTGGAKIGAKVGAEILTAWLKQYYGLS
jgi:hypothetical protein